MRNSLFLKFNIATVFILSIFIFCSSAKATERILDFHSIIRVQNDGSMLVKETIKVNCEGKEIKRGIYRDFPTFYNSVYGLKRTVGFNVIEIRKDGKIEPYFIENIPLGKRTYIGEKYVYLHSGEYTYEITYITTKQLGFYKDYDELYWNVTGNGWIFPIDNAEATVILPAGAVQNITFAKAYTGYRGSTNSNLTDISRSSGELNFKTRTKLAAKEGLTIKVRFPKGYIKEPSQELKSVNFFEDNIGLYIGVIALLILLAYYCICWIFVGVDPEKGIIIPLYNPPGNLSPASLRYIFKMGDDKNENGATISVGSLSSRYIVKMGYDDATLTAAIINIAVKGVIKIEKAYGGLVTSEKFTIFKISNDLSKLSDEEKILVDNLFSECESFSLDNSNRLTLIETVSEFRKILKSKYKKDYFNLNIGYFSVGGLISVVALVAIMYMQNIDKNIISLCVSITILTLASTSLIWNSISAWNETLKGYQSSGKALTRTFIACLSGIFWVVIARQAIMMGLINYVYILVAITALNQLFYHLLKAPTALGREIMDQIEGFRLYLSVAEKDYLNSMTKPDETPELFEKYLPYALALGVENKWAEKFKDVFSRIQQSGETTSNSGYSPGWYSDSSMSSFNASSFTSTLGSAFSSSVASSSSSSESSGGGGGGGGGGW